MHRIRIHRIPRKLVSLFRHAAIGIKRFREYLSTVVAGISRLDPLSIMATAARVVRRQQGGPLAGDPFVSPWSFAELPLRAERRGIGLPGPDPLDRIRSWTGSILCNSEAFRSRCDVPFNVTARAVVHPVF